MKDLKEGIPACGNPQVFEEGLEGLWARRVCRVEGQA